MTEKKNRKKYRAKEKYETPQLEKINISKIYNNPTMSSPSPVIPYVYIE